MNKIIENIDNLLNESDDYNYNKNAISFLMKNIQKKIDLIYKDYEKNKDPKILDRIESIRLLLYDTDNKIGRKK
jgi:hypothetical protein